MVPSTSSLPSPIPLGHQGALTQRRGHTQGPDAAQPAHRPREKGAEVTQKGQAGPTGANTRVSLHTASCVNQISRSTANLDQRDNFINVLT